jgi:hypothetical protein
MNGTEHDPMKTLLQQALPPVEDDSGPVHDLWPALLRRLDEQPAAVPWFDWALIGGVAFMFALFPASIPLLLYYL